MTTILTVIDPTMLCYFFLSVVVVTGVCAYIKTTSYSHAHKCALSLLIKTVRDEDQSDKHPIAKKLLSNMISDKIVHNKDELNKTQEKYSWYAKESAERELTPKQQLVLMDRLLGLNTNLKQAAKIVRTRTAKDIIYLATKALTTGEVKTAPVMLFH